MFLSQTLTTAPSSGKSFGPRPIVACGVGAFGFSRL